MVNLWSSNIFLWSGFRVHRQFAQHSNLTLCQGFCFYYHLSTSVSNFNRKKVIMRTKNLTRDVNWPKEKSWISMSSIDLVETFGRRLLLCAHCYWFYGLALSCLWCLFQTRICVTRWKGSYQMNQWTSVLTSSPAQLTSQSMNSRATAATTS